MALKIFRSLMRHLSAEDGNSFRSRFKLITDSGEKIENPKFSRDGVKLIIPITSTIINANLIEDYCRDHRMAVDFVFYEARIASYLSLEENKNMMIENESDGADDIIRVFYWKFNFRPLYKALLFWIFLLSFSFIELLALFQ